MDDQRTNPEESEDEKPLASGYPAEKARQGRIILKRRWQLIVFLGALVAAVVLAIVWPYVWGS